MQADRFSVYPMLVEVEHAKSSIVIYDSIIRINIPVLVITDSPLYILYEGKGTRLST
jgi:hypothetical protein